MLAALITGQGQVTLKEFPDPTPQPGAVVVSIAYCGICGTDIHAYQSGRPYRPSICGHEWTGTVSAVGVGVSSLTEGDSSRECGAWVRAGAFRALPRLTCALGRGARDCWVRVGHRLGVGGIPAHVFLVVKSHWTLTGGVFKAVHLLTD